MKIREHIFQLLEAQVGWLKSVDFAYNSAYYPVLNDLIAEGKLEQVKKGLYKMINHEQNQDLDVAAKLYPQGVVSMFSAWIYYGLVDDIPGLVHLSFPHKAKPTIYPYPPIKPYFWSQKYYKYGVIDHASFRIYDIERSVCDAIKFRNKIGMDIMEQVIKSYLKRSDRDINKLLKYAAILRVENIITPYLQMLL